MSWELVAGLIGAVTLTLLGIGIRITNDRITTLRRRWERDSNMLWDELRRLDADDRKITDACGALAKATNDALKLQHEVLGNHNEAFEHMHDTVTVLRAAAIAHGWVEETRTPKEQLN